MPVVGVARSARANTSPTKDKVTETKVLTQLCSLPIRNLANAMSSHVDPLDCDCDHSDRVREWWYRSNVASEIPLAIVSRPRVILGRWRNLSGPSL